MLKPVHLPLLLAGLLSAFAAHSVELKSAEQRFSYASGYLFIKQMEAQPIKIDAAALSAAIEDVTKNREPQLTMEEMSKAMEDGKQIIAQARAKEAEGALEAEKKFLQENKGKPGVVELESGLQYIELQAGKGEYPQKGSDVTVNYRGTLVDGTEFDSSYSRGQPATFNLDKVIPGFSEALLKMRPGAKWKLFIPSAMAYGARGAPPAIAPNQTLIFEIELISSSKKATATP
jgi:FKBP-type peptidyl-prolyl cis-trans isomerase